MSTILKAQAKLIDDKMKFECTAGEKYKIITDYTPPYGCGEGTTSLELFLACLCSCVGGTMAVLLRQQGKKVETISVEAQGNRRDKHPTCFEAIDVSVGIKSKDTSREEALKALGIAEQSICPVAAMIKDKVELNYKIELEQ